MQENISNRKALLILVAGPYRSGTNDEPNLIAANLKAMNDVALQLFRAGYLPVLGEWFALPLMQTAGSKALGDEIYNEIFHPVSVALLPHCDGCLRIGGASQGADEMVRLTKELGHPVYYSIEELNAAFKPAE